MLALFSNIGFPEMLVILVVALLLFGKQLPEVAVRVAAHVSRTRRMLTDMWRETGIEGELRRVRRDIDAEQRRIETTLPDWRKALPTLKELDRGASKPSSDTRDADGQALVIPPPRTVSPPSVNKNIGPLAAPAAVSALEPEGERARSREPEPSASETRPPDLSSQTATPPAADVQI